ncbi:MAG: TIR domain-containing protein [Solirubrobacteraceae bacterium]
MPISARTVAALAEPFHGGSGPSHATIEFVWAAAGAEPYLPAKGSKVERILGGFRALKEGLAGGLGQEALPPDDRKLHIVASELATRLLTAKLVDPAAVAEALPETLPQADSEPARDGSDPTTRGQMTTSERGGPALDPAAVMVVCGRDAEAVDAVFDWLRAIGLRPREWVQLMAGVDDASPVIGDILESAFRDAQAVVVLLTPDEHVQLRPGLAPAGEDEWRLQARPNVWLEAGMALGSHPKRTVLLALGDQAIPSDLAGRHFAGVSSPAALRDFAARLARAGCPVDLSGSRWLDTGRFPDRSAVSHQPTQLEPTSEQRRHAEHVLAAEIASALEKVEEVLPPDGRAGSGTWPIGFANWSSTWADRRDQLASVFDQDSFIVLNRAYERLRELERGMEKGGQPLSGEDRAFFARAEEQLRQACDLLR